MVVEGANSALPWGGGGKAKEKGGGGGLGNCVFRWVASRKNGVNLKGKDAGAEFVGGGGGGGHLMP